MDSLFYGRDYCSSIHIGLQMRVITLEFRSAKGASETTLCAQFLVASVDNGGI